LSDRTRLIDVSRQIQRQPFHIREWLPLFLSVLCSCAHSPPPVTPTPSAPSPAADAVGRTNAIGSGPAVFRYAASRWNGELRTVTVEQSTGKKDSSGGKYFIELKSDSVGNMVLRVSPSDSTGCKNAAFAESFSFALAVFPSAVSASSSWQISTTVAGCVGAVPVRTVVRRAYAVSHQPASSEHAVVTVTEAADLEGVAVVGYHNVGISGTGVGEGELQFDSLGFAAATINRTVAIAVRSSRGVSNFQRRTSISVRRAN